MMRDESGTIELPLPPQYQGAIDRAGDGKITAGIRPEHLELADIPNAAPLRATIDVVEFLGNEELLRSITDAARTALGPNRPPTR